MVWTIFVNLESEGAKNLNIEKIIVKVVQMKFLAMDITNTKLSFDIFMEHDLNNDFWHKIKMYNFDPYNVGYCYKYSCAVYDCVCAPGTHIPKTK